MRRGSVYVTCTRLFLLCPALFFCSEAVYGDGLFDIGDLTLYLALTIPMAVRILESYSYLPLALLPS
jgi:hypothetical protein